MKYHFAFQCHNFQRRACWMLSSILQQSIWPFAITVDIACMPNNGNPSTEQVAEYYNKAGLKTQLTTITDKEIFAHRGMVRNIQTQNAIANKADYIFYADADNVYHTDFFKVLNAKLKFNYKTIHNVIFSWTKQHALKDAADNAINYHIEELPYIEKAFEKAVVLPQLFIPPEQDHSGAAAGCMQIVAVRDIVEKLEGVYSNRITNDHDLFEQGQLARSDIKFRKRMGGCTRMRLPTYVHLQHTRDKELGYHTEEQR